MRVRILRVQKLSGQAFKDSGQQQAYDDVDSAAVGINYVAKAFAEGLKLPVWLGTLELFSGKYVIGPVVGSN